MICRIRTNCIDRTFEEPTQKVVFGQTKVTLGCFNWGGSRQRAKRRNQPCQGASGTPPLIQSIQIRQSHRVITPSPNLDEFARQIPSAY
jgi:hypothetical protein